MRQSRQVIKLMKQTKHKSPTSINPPVVGRFVVVSSPKTNDPLREVTGDIEGTFDTIAQAEKYIHNVGSQDFTLDGSNEGRNEN